MRTTLTLVHLVMLLTAGGALCVGVAGLSPGVLAISTKQVLLTLGIGLCAAAVVGAAFLLLGG